MKKESQTQFHRLQLLVGQYGLEELFQTKVLLLGVGGVGSWCAEALVRNGIGNLTIVDSDVVCLTNSNRQLQAMHSTVGMSKVDILANRLRDIHPQATITAINRVYDHDTADSFSLQSYDFVIDAIDSLASKVELIDRALQTEVTLFSSMGASCKLDINRIKVDSFWKTHGCPLAKFVRKRLRYRKITKNFICVFSPENLEPFASTVTCDTGYCASASATGKEAAHEWVSHKKKVNGSAVHITGVFGFHLASLVTNSVLASMQEKHT